MDKNADKIHPSSQDFIEAMGMIYQADSLPRIAGRIVGLLMIKDAPFSLQELSDHLQVSRGSISTNTRLLEQIGMINRIAKLGERQAFYHLAKDPYVNFMEGALLRIKKAQSVVRTAQKNIPKSQKGAHRNLADIRHFYDVTIEGVTDIIKQFPNRQA